MYPYTRRIIYVYIYRTEIRLFISTFFYLLY